MTGVAPPVAGEGGACAGAGGDADELSGRASVNGSAVEDAREIGHGKGGGWHHKGKHP